MTRFVVRDKRPAFSEVVGLVSHSIIAIAVGTSQMCMTSCLILQMPNSGSAALRMRS